MGASPTTGGELVAMSPEEIVILPEALGKGAKVKVRVHFPRLGFVVRPVGGAARL